MRIKYMVYAFSFAVLILTGTGQALIDVDIDGDGRSFSPGDQYLDSRISITFDELLPKTSWVYIYINDETFPRERISLDRYIRSEAAYDFVNQTFGYTITADGTNTWKEYPPQDLSYRVSVSGQCGDETCLVGEPPNQVDNCGGPENCGVCSGIPGGFWTGSYPCSWSVERTGFFDGTVDGDPELTGLKLIENTDGNIQIPASAVPGSVTWAVEEAPTNPSQVEVTMRAACKGMSYGNSWPADESGWIINDITASTGQSCTSITERGMEGALEGTDCRVNIGHTFDTNSLSEGYRKYGGPGYLLGGGIYKDGAYQQWGSDVDWDGTKGEILIKDFDSRAYYKMAYLPSNGPMVCAYTSYSISDSDPWASSHEVTGAQAGYLEPYQKLFTQQELDGISDLSNPGCPASVPQYRCTLGEASYQASADPSGTVEVSYDYSQGLSVTGTSSLKSLEKEETISLNTSDFDVSIEDITKDIGNHTLRLEIIDGINDLWSGSFELFICDDADGDGFCAKSGDCDDTNNLVHPGMDEVCDGLDNDCDGAIDEGISGMGEQLNQPCNDWKGSVCAGTWVCNPGGSLLVCKSASGINQGDREEVCGNLLDDDCDGTVDEQYELVNDTQVKACTDDDIYCIEGRKRECGECRDGVSTCINGQWSPCDGAGKPGVETCNREDDDCDGVIDNVFGKSSVKETQCGCYDNANPIMEICNSIDDDCDGKIDDGVTSCCTPGNKRDCGTNAGACEYGIQECEGGSWGECRGAVDPKNEVCCDGLDNDCNGYVDEGCSDDACDIRTETDQMSVWYWAMIGIGVILLMGVIIFREFRR